MFQVPTMSWCSAVAVLTLATFIGWNSVLAANAVQTQFCAKFVEPLGYICSEYRTYSADGYELVMHRVGTRPRQRVNGSPQSSEADDPYATLLNCADVNQPFNSPGCSRLNTSSDEGDTAGSDELSAVDHKASIEQKLPYQTDQTPITSQDLPYQTDQSPSTSENLPYQTDQTPSSNDLMRLQDEQAQEQELLPGSNPFWSWRDEDEERQHTDLPSQTGLEPQPFKTSVQLPIHHSRNISLSDKRTEGKHHKANSVPAEKAESPHGSGLKHHGHQGSAVKHHGHHGSAVKHHGHHPRHNAIVTGSLDDASSGSDLRTASEGLSTKRNKSPGTSRRKSRKQRRPASVPSTSSSRSPSVAAPKAVANSTSSPSLDQNSEKFTRGKVPVLVMHQEFMNGDSWFQSTDTADRLFPLLLVDAGFDVWIGHQRATYWSHGHKSLRADDKLYWDWTWDELARYDVPALLELINSTTGFAPHYVGLSQSATAGAAAATMPKISQFMRSLTLIGPTIYRGDTSSIVLNAWAFLFGSAIDQTYYNEGYQNGAFNYTRAFPVNYLTGQGPVGAALETISGPNCCFGSTMIFFTNGWDGTTSYKNLIHYQQGVRTNFWRRFDYGGPDNNTAVYGVPFPPEYLPEDIPSDIPILVVYGGQDILSPVGGMRYLLSRLGTRWEQVYLPDYAHYDLSYSVNRTQDVFIPILQFLEAHRWK